MIVQNVSAAATGPHRHLLHPAQDRGRRRRWHALDGRKGERRLRVAAVRRPDRQDLAGRRRHAHAPRASPRSSSRRSPTPGVNIEMISHVRDPHLGRHPRGRRRRGRARRAHGVRPRRRAGRGRRLRRHRPMNVNQTQSSGAQAHPRGRRCDRRRRHGDAQDPLSARGRLGRDPSGRLGALGRQAAERARRGGRGRRARPRGVRRRRRRDVRRARRGRAAVGADRRGSAAPSWSTTPAPSGWTPRCRSSSPR